MKKNEKRVMKRGGGLAEILAVCVCLLILGPILVPVGVLMLGGGDRFLSDPSFWKAYLMVFGALTALFAVCVWVCWDNLNSSLKSVKGRLSSLDAEGKQDKPA